MGVRRAERGDAEDRGSWRSSFLGAASAKFSAENWDRSKKTGKGANERSKGLWKLAPPMEIRPHRGFPQRLGKHKPLSTVPTRPNSSPSFFFERQRYTLNWLTCGPKNGEHFNLRLYDYKWDTVLCKKSRNLGAFCAD